MKKILIFSLIFFVILCFGYLDDIGAQSTDKLLLVQDVECQEIVSPFQLSNLKFKELQIEQKFDLYMKVELTKSMKIERLMVNNDVLNLNNGFDKEYQFRYS